MSKLISFDDLLGYDTSKQRELYEAKERKKEERKNHRKRLVDIMRAARRVEYTLPTELVVMWTHYICSCGSIHDAPTYKNPCFIRRALANGYEYTPAHAELYSHLPVVQEFQEAHIMCCPACIGIPGRRWFDKFYPLVCKSQTKALVPYGKYPTRIL